jgi:hypothetical protein
MTSEPEVPECPIGLANLLQSLFDGPTDSFLLTLRFRQGISFDGPLGLSKSEA